MLALVIVATSVGSALIALMIISVQLGQRRKAAALAVQPALEQSVFLFDDQDLVDATAPARALLNASPMGGSDWARLSAFLATRFDDFASILGSLSSRGTIEMVARSPDGTAPLRLFAEDVNGMARIALTDPEVEGHGVVVDGLSHRALEDELEHLRVTMDRAPVLCWRENATGSVIWANRAYILRSDALANADDALTWPLPHLFGAEAATPESGPRRMKINAPDGKVFWFEWQSYRLESGTLNFAVSIDGTVRAERALRDFVQTLTKTFADLPIGLAIFDRQRQLQLFNPALIELTQLGAEFLSCRPTLYAFLDRLREGRMMPEMKDYRSWRQQMTALEQAAAAGHHSETWSLPSGQTYRVTGRPHPDGAVAFLFEDISSEVSLTRRFRAELELGHEVLDALQEAVAVFQPSGELVTSNAAYAQMWGVDPRTTLGQVTALDSIRIWQDKCQPSPIWATARDFTTQIGNRTAWAGEATLANGQRIICRFVPLTGGTTLAGFTPLMQSALQNPTIRTAEPVGA
ncbi:PAS-domain containing protein [Phaeovulum sp.]|uniref:PAS-domain containing protein n=1 Tax=Phaeovulum sp. TaxID=2934796 RepID=UPI0039E71F7E